MFFSCTTQPPAKPVYNGYFSEEELLARAAAEGITLRGLSSYCAVRPPQPSTLVVGYGGVRDADIPDAAARLKRAWE